MDFLSSRKSYERTSLRLKCLRDAEGAMRSFDLMVLMQHFRSQARRKRRKKKIMSVSMEELKDIFKDDPEKLQNSLDLINKGNFNPGQAISIVMFHECVANLVKSGVITRLQGLYIKELAVAFNHGRADVMEEKDFQALIANLGKTESRGADA